MGRRLKQARSQANTSNFSPPLRKLKKPYKPDDGESKPMKFQTYKKNAYVPCNSTLNHENSYEEQYKKSIQTQTKQLQDRPYLYTKFQDDKYFANWAGK